MNKNGDLIIEFSEDNEISSSRLFYGLTKDGRYFFKNQTSYTYDINIDYENFEELVHFELNYEITNLFVSITNAPSKGNKYLLSINSYCSTVELRDFNNDYNNHYAWIFQNFFNLEKNNYLFLYEPILIALPEQNTYIIAFFPKFNITEDILDIDFMKKFRIKSFDNDAYEEISTIKYSDFLNNKVLSIMLMEDLDILVVITYKTGNVLFRLYNYDLVPFNNDIEIYLNINLYNDFQEDMYLKAFYLNDNYILLIYPSTSCLYFDLNIIDYDEIWRTMTMHFIIAKLDEFLSDIIKINDIKLVYICTNIAIEGYSLQTSNILNIFIINVEDFGSLILDVEHYILFFFEDYIPTMYFFGIYFKDYLLLSTNYKTFDDTNNYFSMLMILGYVNGTDCTIDISYWLNDMENNKDNNISFFEFLYQNFSIENNIFGYIPENIVKLTFIPKEILILKQDELLPLENNTLINQTDNYILQQNIKLTKTSQYYYIDYQYIVKELNGIINDEHGDKVYYGRTNRLKFKLCHEYCETCYELGINNNEQKCSSCLPMY